MEIHELTREQQDLLKKPLPREAVSPHPTKAYLSTIKAIYVIERFNEVFGVGKWGLDSEVLEKDAKMVVVETALVVPRYGIELTAFGGNDNPDRGDAYKGAVTDAVTKIGSYLGVGMDVFKGMHDAPKAAANAAAPRGSDRSPDPTADKQALNEIM